MHSHFMLITKILYYLFYLVLVDNTLLCVLLIKNGLAFVNYTSPMML